MRRQLLVLVFATGLTLGGAASAQAIEFCLSTPPFGSIYRIELTPAGNFFSLVGRDRVFFERPIAGSAEIEASGTAIRLGFTYYLGDGAIFYNVQINFATLTGPYKFIGVPSLTTNIGTALIVECGAAVDLDTSNLKDPAAR